MSASPFLYYSYLESSFMYDFHIVPVENGESDEMKILYKTAQKVIKHFVT